MSETALAAAPMTVLTTDPARREPLLTAQLVIALYGMTILAGSLAAVFCIKDLSPLQGTIAGATVSGLLSGVMGFYFGSSKGSQAKDDVIAGKVGSPVPAAPAS